MVNHEEMCIKNPYSKYLNCWNGAEHSFCSLAHLDCPASLFLIIFYLIMPVSECLLHKVKLLYYFKGTICKTLSLFPRSSNVDNLSG